MKMAEPGRGALLAFAILWTGITAIWCVVMVLRFRSSYEDEGLQAMSVITALTSFAACVINWLRYINHTHDQGGNDDE